MLCRGWGSSDFLSKSKVKIIFFKLPFPKYVNFGKSNRSDFILQYTDESAKAIKIKTATYRELPRLSCAWGFMIFKQFYISIALLEQGKLYGVHCRPVMKQSCAFETLKQFLYCNKKK